MPELVLKLGDNTLQTYVFDKDVMSIGRSRDNDVVVENLSVSRNHARIRRQTGKYILTDLNSANGTYVNGVRVSKTEIVNEDVISIGKHKLHFADQPVEEEKMIADAFGADRTVVVDRVPAPVLCISDGKLKGQEFQITKFETSIGKSPSNDIVLSDDWFLAKKQAVIIRRGNHDYEIHDMGGFKRTKVNGVQINEAKPLQPGDVLEFGNTRCVFQYAGDVQVPSGRVPQEMALDDSIFSSGVSYQEPAEAQRGPDIETPFMASAEPASAEELFDDEGPAFDTGEMAREAIAADEQARAEVRLQSASPSPDFAAAHLGNGHDLDAHFDEPPPPEPPKEDSIDFISMDDEVPSAYGTFAEAYSSHESAAPAEEISEAVEAAEPTASESQPEAEEAPVFASVSSELESNADAVAFAADAAVMMPGLPITPTAPEPESNSEPMVSASGGRSNRKKKRERQSQEPASAPAENAAASAEEPPPTFDERIEQDGPQTAEAQPEAIPNEESEPTGATPAEIALWEAALTNRSAVIRRQAAKMLKKLTGKDYEV